MHSTRPVYTEKARCQDCYRCVRNCPVKAIKIDNGIASVIDERCVYCGTCVNICPAEAKKVRNDLDTLFAVLNNNETVIASVAPSYIAEFPGMTEEYLAGSLMRAGFFGVSETALGAQEVSAHAAALIEGNNGTKTFISSACPAVVTFIRKYHPSMVPFLTPLHSPLLAHCRMLKKRYPGARVAFFGPCIAKKTEADAYPELCDVALTFDDLRKLLETVSDRLPADLAGNACFIPEKAREGTLYPVDGGMISGMGERYGVTDGSAMHFSGMSEVASVLRSLETGTQGYPLFLELLACPGGCINGPVTTSAPGTLQKRVAIVRSAPATGRTTRIKPSENIVANFSMEPVRFTIFTDEEIGNVLRMTGKYSKKEELNCGGCGYANCREFAAAVLSGNAETSMCVTYMRQLALKKANKLISAMPSGVAIVGSDLSIIECNERFAALAGGDSVTVYNSIPGMKGAMLDKVLPVAHLFRHVLQGDGEITGKDLPIGNRILRCSIFSIEPSSIAGGIFSDITDPELKRDEIVKRAQRVIRKNLTTVQKIAYLLGENASETEMVLSTIIDSYKPGDTHDSRH